MLPVLADQGFAVVAADLDEGFPAQLRGADLVWAASSLHHVGDVPRLLADVRAALAPGGVLVVVELEDLPRFTADPVEDRARAAARAAGWNHHPDWTPHLREAGFAVERHDLVLDVAPSTAAEEFARAWLPRYLAVPGFDEPRRCRPCSTATWCWNPGRSARCGWPGERPLEVDVAVVGGGAAGLAAAVALGRSLRSVVVVDAGEPRNAPAAHAHNVLGREGIGPLDLLAAGREEARGYGVRFLADRVVTADREVAGFRLGLLGGSGVRARRLLLATGLVDELPEVPGLRRWWGTGVLHCPFCHGYEVRGQHVGVLGSRPGSLHQVLLFRALTDRVTFFRQDLDVPPETAAQFRALGSRSSRAPSEG